MNHCSECGTQIDPVTGYGCDHCSGQFCDDHRLPEKHGCIAARGSDASTLAGRVGGAVLGNEESAEEDDADDNDRSKRPQNRAPSRSRGPSKGALVIKWRRFRRQLRRVRRAMPGARTTIVLALIVGAVAASPVGFGFVTMDDFEGGVPSEPVVSGVSGNEDFNKTRAERLIFQKVNEIRDDRQRHRFRWNVEAARVAQAHADDMARNDYFSHTNSEGRGQNVRYGFCGGGENIAQTYFDQPVRTPDGGTTTHTDADDIATGAVEQWMNSDPHRERGLLGPWVSAGVGVARSGDTVYIVMGFCLP